MATPGIERTGQASFEPIEAETSESEATVPAPTASQEVRRGSAPRNLLAGFEPPPDEAAQAAGASAVAAPADAEARPEPAWMGETAVRIDRGDPDRPPQRIEESYSFDTWARQRAAITEFLFQVWVPGLTDQDPLPGDLWQKLDVQIHYRYGNSGPFKRDYVHLKGESGNNAVYGFDLRQFDPWRASDYGPEGWRNLPEPGVPTRTSPDGRYQEAELQFYFTVNGKELRPPNGEVFRGIYSQYPTAP